MWLWTKFSIFIWLTSSACGQSQNGGYLLCQDQWIDGENVMLEFRINASLYPTLCPGATSNGPYFEKKNTASGSASSNCTVPDITTSTGCTSHQADQLGCGCVEQSSGSFIVKYNFIAHKDYNGWWDAQLQCFDSFGFQQLTFAARDCDNKTVIANTCKNITCLNGGVCYHDSNNAAKCNCSAGYTGDRCELGKCENNGPCVRGTCIIDENGVVVCDCTGTGYVKPCCDDLDPFVIALISVATFLALFSLALAVIVIVMMVTDYESKRVFDVMTSNNLAKFIGYLDSTPCQMELDNDNKGTVGLCGSVSVNVCGHCLDKTKYTHSDNKPPRILVRGKLIWYFCLNTRADEIERRFLREMKPRGLPGPPPPCPEQTGNPDITVDPPPPPPDDSVGSQKSNGNSERPTNGRDSVTEM